MSHIHTVHVRRPSLRRAFLLALVPAVVLAGRLAKSEVVHVPTDDGGTWAITITPARRTLALVQEPTAPLPEADEPANSQAPSVSEPAAAEEPKPSRPESPTPMPPAPAPAVVEKPLALVPDTGMAIIPNYDEPSEADAYERLYDSIPFSRAEYLANPAYRHEATLELMFGQLRPTTVHKHYTPRINESYVPDTYQPYRFAHPDYWQYRPPLLRYLYPPGFGYGY